MDPKLRPGTNRCKCAACGEYFNSVYAFELHRRGDYSDRKCLNPEQMVNKGMAISEAGFWISEKNSRTAHS